MSEHLELYQRLGFDNNTPTAKEIKKRYRRLVKDCHPDQHPNDEDKEQQFKLITEAYEVLSDEKKRADYDSTGELDTGNEEKQVNELAINLLTKVFIGMLDQIPEEAMNNNDIREPVFDNIRTNLAQKAEQVRMAESIIRKNKKARKKLSRKTSGTSDILGRAIDERLGVVTAQLKMLNFMVKVCNRMKDIISDYDYDFNDFDSGMPSFGNGPFQITYVKSNLRNL